MVLPLSRRRFLQGVSAAGAAAALGACAGEDSDGNASDPSTTIAPEAGGSPGTADGTSTDGVLVLVTLYGGNDALNTVSPVTDDRYRSVRGALALDPATTHDIGEGFALHPNLASCKALWDDGRFAVVHGVGFDGLDRSHFHCMDVWQAGDADHTTTGWIGRWLDAAGTSPLDAVVVGGGLPLLARGARRAAAVVPTGPFDLPGDPALARLLATQVGAQDERAELEALVARSGADLLEVVGTVSPMLASVTPGDTLTDRLGVVATLLEAGLPARVFAVDLGNFDTHAQQAAAHDPLLAELDAGIGSFLERVGTAELDRPVTVVAYSEFGRRVAANASAGTDHGSAGTVLLAGAVRPGHHGEPPPLDTLVEGDLATTVDFRSVFGGLAEGVLGVEAVDVLPGSHRPLTLV